LRGWQLRLEPVVPKVAVVPTEAADEVKVPPPTLYWEQRELLQLEAELAA